jgi:transcriptional regulator with XRE-family HTH domain
MKNKKISVSISPIRQWRGLKGISQIELCQNAGITRAALARIERNKAKPQKGTLEKLASALNLTVQQLLDGPMPDKTRPIRKTEDFTSQLFSWRPFDNTKNGKRNSYDAEGVLKSFYDKSDKKDGYLNFRIIDDDKNVDAETIKAFDLIRKAEKCQLEKIIIYIEKILKKKAAA